MTKEFKYMRYCPYCNHLKKYTSRFAKNNKHRCPECLNKFWAKKYKKMILCKYCGKIKFKDITDFFYHITDDKWNFFIF